MAVVAPDHLRPCFCDFLKEELFSAQRLVLILLAVMDRYYQNVVKGVDGADKGEQFLLHLVVTVIVDQIDQLMAVPDIDKGGKTDESQGPGAHFD